MNMHYIRSELLQHGARLAIAGRVMNTAEHRRPFPYTGRYVFIIKGQSPDLVSVGLQQVLLGLQNGINAGDGTEGSGLGFFLNGRINSIEGDGNASERSSDGFGGGFTLGVDMPIGDELFAGGALGFTHIDTHYSGSGSQSSLDALTLTGYGAFYPTDALYLDGSGTLSWLGFKTENELLLLDGGPDAHEKWPQMALDVPA